MSGPDKLRVVVIDAGVGNTGNVLRALRHLGAEPELTADPAAVAAATCLVLPGVGAFRPPRERLCGVLEEALFAALDRGAFLLGICVGYQLLFRESSEFGATPGLALLDGTVDVLPAGVPLPHIGWNRLIERREHPLLAGLPEEAWVYFVHSYAPRGVPEDDVLARTLHGDSFPAIAGRGRVFGCQFHPEKSGATGLRILANFLALAARGEEPAGPVAPPRRSAPAVAGLELLPSIDLRHGEVVRLRQGDDLFRSKYGRDPRRLLAEFAAAGARRVHLVDLDAAFGEAPQRELIAELVRSTALAVELGGGLRDEAAILWAKEIGCERVVLGSLFLKDPAVFAELARRHAGFLVPALELRGNVPQAAGWREGAALSLETLAAALRGLPCPAMLVTDIERDGTLGGPNVALASRLAELTGLPAIVSGGVAGLSDLEAAAAAPGVAALIVGRAFYEGRFDLAEGFARLARLPPRQGTASGLGRRLVPCLDVKDGRVVKGLRFENLRDLGDPAECAAAYAAEGADEIVFLDITAAPDGRDTRLDWVEQVAEKVFVPLTVGGGVRSLADAERLLRAGADKVAVNSAAFERPELLGEIAEKFGRQCVVLSVDVRRRPEEDGGEAACRMAELDAEGRLPETRSGWEVVTHGGRKPRGRDALAYIADGVAGGAGEILLTSIDADGTREGYDLALLRAAASKVSVPIVASGGAGTVDHLARGLAAGAQAVLAASMFHERTHRISEVKEELARRGFPLRPADPPGLGRDLPALPEESRTSPAPAPRPALAFLQLPDQELAFDDRGLLPVVVQEEGSGAVLMLAWANAEAIARTRESGDAWFWSRSRQELWRKGATSGNELKVVSIAADCDADSVLYRVRAAGPACHTGSRSCFASRPGETDPAALELGWLYAILEQRRRAPPAESYTARLLQEGRPRIAQKVGEEAVETVIAALSGNRDELVGEASDLLYHLLVLLLDCGVRPEELTRKLLSRHQGASR